MGSHSLWKSGNANEECHIHGAFARSGANVVATECQFRQNGMSGVWVTGPLTTTRLTNCTSHHGVGAPAGGAVVNLMGEGTSVHNNERYGMLACWEHGTTINVHQPCVLNDMFHGNRGQNIHMLGDGTVQRKGSNK